MLSKRYIIGLAIMYVIIGMVFWNRGFMEAPTFREQSFSFFYIILLWPFLVGAKLVWENYILSVL